MEPPTDRKRMEVTVCNPFIPAGDYRRGLELTLQTIAPHLTHRELVTLVHKKLRMEDPGPAEAQYLQAAVELTVCAHYARYFNSSFVYEDRVMPPRDVDCSFCSGDYKFNVEVKCADYTAKHKVDLGSEFIIRAIGRQPDYRDTVAKDGLK